MTLGGARTTTRGALALDGTLSYWRVDPSAASVNQWGLSLTGRRMLTRRWVLMGRSKLDVNHVQYLEYRSTTVGGLGYLVVQSQRVSLLVAPGLGWLGAPASRALSGRGPARRLRLGRRDGLVARE